MIALASAAFDLVAARGAEGPHWVESGRSARKSQSLAWRRDFLGHTFLLDGLGDSDGARQRVMLRPMEHFGITLENVALLSQVAGVIAVFASLIFVGLQIREQANATSAQTEQAIASNWMALAQVIGGSAEAFTAGLVSTNATFADLNDADRMRFLTALFALFKHYENMYLQFKKGRIGEAEWEPWSNHIQMYFHQPGVQTWWSLRKSAFSLVFRAFLDDSVAPRELSPAALHHAAAKA